MEKITTKKKVLNPPKTLIVQSKMQGFRKALLQEQKNHLFDSFKGGSCCQNHVLQGV